MSKEKDFDSVLEELFNKLKECGDSDAFGEKEPSEELLETQINAMGAWVFGRIQHGQGDMEQSIFFNRVLSAYTHYQIQKKSDEEEQEGEE